MIRNYIKIAWRNLLRNKITSGINILGLSLGLALAILIGLWIWEELTFNHYYANYNTIAQVMVTSKSNNQVLTKPFVPMPLGEELRIKFGHNFKYVALTSWNNPMVIAYKERAFSEPGMWVEPGFVSMMPFQVIQGNINCLNDLSSVLIASSLAKVLFGNTNPINRLIRVSNKYELKVGGVYEDFPENTTFHQIQLFLSWHKYLTTEVWMSNASHEWGNNGFQCFVQLSEKRSSDEVTNDIQNIIKYHEFRNTDRLTLFPMDKWRLYNNFQNGKIASGAIQYVWLFGIIGVFVLMLACINYMNLSTATVDRRKREVGIRKVVGSRRKQLIGQFISESVIIAFVAMILAVLLVQIFIPVFGDIAGRQFHFPWASLGFWAILILFTSLLGLVAGSYPAYYLSNFKTLSALNRASKQGSLSALPRKSLVVLQFTISITIITGTAIVYEQVKFAKNRSSGYDRTGLITIQMNTPDLIGHYEALRQNLLQTGAVANMAESSSETTKIRTTRSDFDWQGKDPGKELKLSVVAVTSDFGATIGWHIAQGRDFGRSVAADSSSLLVNESALRLLGFKDPIGKILIYEKKPFTIIGVVKDMIMASPYESVQPGVFICDYEWANVITIKIKPGTERKNALVKIGSVFKMINKQNPFDYAVNSEEYDKKFGNEEHIGVVAGYFSFLAIFISLLGLYGLATFLAAKRTKEVGIRKVLGASVVDMWKLLSLDFISLVIIACLISTIISWLALNSWLKHYEYHTEISWTLFFNIGFATVALTMITVSYQALKAATANPTKTIKMD